MRPPSTLAHAGDRYEPSPSPVHELRGDARDVGAWPDAWLVNAVRRDPPDVAALDALVARHWKGLFGRCRLLAMNDDVANDLAQETWVRVLRARRRMEPDGNVAGYLATIATNLWRDSRRAGRRAGALASHRLASLDAATLSGDGEGGPLADALPDLAALSRERQAELRLDIDRALALLPSRSREVLVARYLDGQSAAEIGRRHGRTEQAVTAWLRQAIREIGQHLDGHDVRDHDVRAQDARILNVPRA